MYLFSKKHKKKKTKIKNLLSVSIKLPENVFVSF